MTEIKEGFDLIARRAEEAARENTRIDWESVALNALTIPLLGIPINAEDTSKLDSVPMDDEWLGAVSGLPTISKQGLRFLSDAVAAKGWVSVREAVRFIEIEQKAASLQKEKAEGEERRTNVGTAMLLARAERELPGTIARVTEGAKDLAEAAANVVIFTKEAALATGRSMGAAAEWLRNRRI